MRFKASASEVGNLRAGGRPEEIEVKRWKVNEREKTRDDHEDKDLVLRWYNLSGLATCIVFVCLVARNRHSYQGI